MNKIQLRGRVGADPEVRTLQSGVKVATFSLATEESWLVEGERLLQQRDFLGVERHPGAAMIFFQPALAFAGHDHLVETFRPADVAVIEAHVTKGALMRVDGSVRVDDWKDKNEVKHYTTKIVTSDWEHGIYPDHRGAAKAKDAAD